MVDNFEFKDDYDIDDLISIVTLLRSPKGCPWDMAQTHESIKKNFIEETYEVVEAINRKSTDALREELGDVLLQIALHTEMERKTEVSIFVMFAMSFVKSLLSNTPMFLMTPKRITKTRLSKAGTTLSLSQRE